LAHRHEDEEVTSVRGSSGSSSRAAVCDDPAAIKAARIRQGLLVLMVRVAEGTCCRDCSGPVCCCQLAARLCSEACFIWFGRCAQAEGDGRETGSPEQ
jgi:hypothetical protein